MAPSGGGSSLQAAVADAVLQKYASLPKNGKPQAHEYTLLAGFATTDERHPDAPPKVVALGTGTKCLGGDKRCVNGMALADSHAEVLARRALVLYMYDEIARLCDAGREGALANPGVSIFQPGERSGETTLNDDGTVDWTRTRLWCSLRPGVAVHMYVSQSPCGDASIFETSLDGMNDGAANPERSAIIRTNKRAKTAANLGAGSTGAKLLTGDGDGETDAEFGVGAQMPGAARLKPGRGTPTSCMSCSDKMCKWNALGVQGELLSGILERPVRIASITVATPTDAPDTDAHITALHRAVFGRIEKPYNAGVGYAQTQLCLRKSDGNNLTKLAAPTLSSHEPPPPNLSSASGQRLGWVACGSSINWIADSRSVSGGGGSTEVTLGATGRKAGFNKKNVHSPKSASRLCRASLARRFIELAPRFAIDLSRRRIGERVVSELTDGFFREVKTLRYDELKGLSDNNWSVRSDLGNDAYRRLRRVLIRPQDSMGATNEYFLGPERGHAMYDSPLCEWVPKRPKVTVDEFRWNQFRCEDAKPMDPAWEPEGSSDDAGAN